jgi:O-antigen/teichoic acid export membrane protein
MRTRPAALLALLREKLSGANAPTQRAAAFAFGIRLASAAATYLSQAVLARWLGDSAFGIYVYVFTWVLVAGDLVHLGLPLAAQRFIPQYRARDAHDLLRGFISGMRRVGVTGAILATLFGAALVRVFTPWLDPREVAPLYLGCLAIPFFTLSVLLDGVARNFNWIGLALSPYFLFRPLLVLALMAGGHFLGFAADATSAMLAVVLASASMALLQWALITRRLRGVVPSGARAYEMRTWLAAAAPIGLVWGCYTLLTYTDILVLQQFRPSEEVALYYAVTRTLLLSSFVYFAVGAAAAHRFTAYHIAGNRDGLVTLVRSTVNWTFWPSLAATALVLAMGKPLLWLFGPDFIAGYPLMFILAIGPLARASVGPAERLLNMLGEQRRCALVYGGAFVLNLAACLALAPRYGAAGAAISISAAMVAESAALFWVARARLGLNIFIWRGQRA